MSVSAPVSSSAAPAPRRYEVRRDVMVVEGHALAGVELAGYLVGQPLGSAPVVIVVGGITASPFPFGDAASGAEPWWPALQAPDLVDPSNATVLCPCWPGNGSTWRGFDDGARALENSARSLTAQLASSRSKRARASSGFPLISRTAMRILAGSSRTTRRSESRRASTSPARVSAAA